MANTAASVWARDGGTRVAGELKVVVQGASGPSEVPGIAALAGRAELRFASGAAALRRALPGAQVLLGWSFTDRALADAWESADALRWIHWAGAGVDAVLFPGLVGSAVTLTNARGLFDRAMAESVLGFIIAFAKHLPQTLALQARHEWRHRLTERIAGRHALVVGAGSIGRETGRLLRAAGMRVSGASRTAREHDPDLGTVWPLARLHEALGVADYVVLIAPLTPATRGMFGAAEFAAMRRRARFINIGRGALVDEAALVDALRAGVIAGAALDVFASEPLADTSPLWDMPGVIISPHMSGDYDEWKPDMVQDFLANLERFLAGEPLANVVDKRLGFVPH